MKGPTTDFVFEIGCEEIPAGMLPGAAKELKAILEKYLSTYNLMETASVETFAAPRRLAATCTGIRIKQADETKEVMGPPKSVSFDAGRQADPGGRELCSKNRDPRRETFPCGDAQGRVPGGPASNSREIRKRDPGGNPPAAPLKRFPGHEVCIGPAPRGFILFGRFVG